MKNIYAQGDLDGACFLYSTANAYRALTGKNIGKSAWANAMRGVFFPEDFLDGGARGGTERYRDNPMLFETALKHMFSCFSEKNGISLNIAPQTVKGIGGIKKLISPTSVVIFCYKVEKSGKIEINHWTCGVGYSDSPIKIRVACSSSDFEENKDEKFNRWFTEEIPDDISTTIFDGSVFQISLNS